MIKYIMIEHSKSEIPRIIGLLESKYSMPALRHVDNDREKTIDIIPISYIYVNFNLDYVVKLFHTGEEMSVILNPRICDLLAKRNYFK